MVAGTMRSLRSHRQNVGRFDWPTLTSLFMQNTMLAPLDDEIRRNDRLVKEGTTLFKSRSNSGAESAAAETEVSYCGTEDMTIIEGNALPLAP